MAKQISFYYKNRGDITNPDVIYTASQGQDYVNYAFNRSNYTGWQTTGSADSDNTTFEVDFVDSRDLTDIMLMGHNFDSYNLQYWNGSIYTNFSPSISESGYSGDNSHHEFTEISTTKVKLTITGTQIADSDKILRQFILTKKIGQLTGWPQILKPQISRNRKKKKMLSGKVNLIENVGGVGFNLRVKNWNIDADLSLIETLYNSNQGFLVWISGGDESQFSSVRELYRYEDIYLMKCANEHSPEWASGIYVNGQKITIKLVETTD